MGASVSALGVYAWVAAPVRGGEDPDYCAGPRRARRSRSVRSSGQNGGVVPYRAAHSPEGMVGGLVQPRSVRITDSDFVDRVATSGRRRDATPG